LVRKPRSRVPEQDRWFVTKISDVAKFFSLSQATLTDSIWFQHYRTEKPAKGYYLPDLNWLQLEHVRGHLRDPDDDTSTLADERRKDVRESRLKKERERQIATGKLYPKEDVNQKAMSLAIAIRTGLMSLPLRIANIVPGSQKAVVENLVKAEVLNALIRVRDTRLSNAEIRREIKAWAKEIEAEEELEATKPKTEILTTTVKRDPKPKRKAPTKRKTTKRKTKKKRPLKK